MIAALAGALAFLSAAAPAVAQIPTVTTVASLHSTNPTAVPLTAINSAASGQPTVSISQPATPGATPPISGAPPLPSWSFAPTLGFPTLDEVPPTNSTLVQQWIAQVAATGIKIPDIPLSKDGSCASDPAKAANASICWWTCGGCTRETDITTCPDKLTWGLSYDDGPSPYSTDLLNYLDANDLHTTFFIVGSRAISRPDILQAEFMQGHQLAVHTWSHPYLTTLTNDQIIAELGWTKKAIHDITGLTPNVFRPPYGDIDDRVRAILKAMDLVPVMWSNISTNYFDTDDWHIPAGYPVDGVIDNFESILNNASTMNTGFIVLEHDLYQQTVDLAIGYILPDALARKNLKLESIIECLHQPLSNAYIETNNNQTNPLGAASTFPASGASTTGSGTSGGSKSTGSASKGASTPSNTQGGQTSPSTTKSAAAMGVRVPVGGVVSAAIALVGAVVGAAVVL